jgi:hypothetical protein
MTSNSIRSGNCTVCGEPRDWQLDGHPQTVCYACAHPLQLRPEFVCPDPCPPRCTMTKCILPEGHEGACARAHYAGCSLDKDHLGPCFLPGLGKPIPPTGLRGFTEFAAACAPLSKDSVDAAAIELRALWRATSLPVRAYATAFRILKDANAHDESFELLRMLNDFRAVDSWHKTPASNPTREEAIFALTQISALIDAFKRGPAPRNRAAVASSIMELSDTVDRIGAVLRGVPGVRGA